MHVGYKVKMEMIDEDIWFHKTKVHTIVQSYNYLDKFST
jgi:hypothetical protein